MKSILVVITCGLMIAPRLHAEKNVNELISRVKEGEQKVIPELLAEIWINENIQGAISCVNSYDRDLISAFKWKFVNTLDSRFKDKLSLIALRSGAEFWDRKGSNIPPSSSAFRENNSIKDAVLYSLKKYYIVTDKQDSEIVLDHKSNIYYADQLARKLDIDILELEKQERESKLIYGVQDKIPKIESQVTSGVVSDKLDESANPNYLKSKASWIFVISIGLISIILFWLWRTRAR